MIWKHVDELLSAERRAWLDRIFAVGYEGDSKVVMDATRGTFSAYDVARDPLERSDVLPSRSESLEPLRRAVGLVGEQLLHDAKPMTSPEVEERLKSWGYV